MLEQNFANINTEINLIKNIFKVDDSISFSQVKKHTCNII